MNPHVHLVLILHDHQPVGNFDGVIEQSYQDSYLPFLDVFEQHSEIPIGLHVSGCLMEWIDTHHPKYLERLRGLIAKGKVEILGGAFYEPILTMISPRDRVGQITSYTDWLRRKLGTTIAGMWMPERVWEQSLTGDLTKAGIRYTLLDDFHFKMAGLKDDELHGYYVTEEDANLLAVFPGSERLRYLIPFAPPDESIRYLRSIAEQQPGALVVFGDDGEKFGSWPGTKNYVYEQGWLRNFLGALGDNREWLHVITPSQAIDTIEPLGRLYIPEGSYREMTEWALPAQQLMRFEDIKHGLQHESRWDDIATFVRGGYWRNFKTKYPETNEMYSRMQIVSQRLSDAVENGVRGEKIDQARSELYRGQCNCAYWHGAFGGAYLPHLRHAIFHRLIRAENKLDEAEGRGLAEGDSPWVDVDAGDFNFDSRPEIRLASNRIVALIAPVEGGMLYELDARAIGHNLLATFNRRQEAYHRKVLAGETASGDNVASIHDRVVFKQAGLDKRLQYDHYPRKSLIDHFFDQNTTAETFEEGSFRECGDFVGTLYEAKLRRNPDRMQVQLSRAGRVDDVSVRITKGVTLNAGGDTLEIAYLLEGLPPGWQARFGVELNFAGLPADAIGRLFVGSQGEPLGHLGTRLNLEDVESLDLIDEWLGINCGLKINRPTGIWAHPLETVSQSEAGFELVHQSVVVLPHWLVRADSAGRWSVTLNLTLDTSSAEARQSTRPPVAVGAE